MFICDVMIDVIQTLETSATEENSHDQKTKHPPGFPALEQHALKTQERSLRLKALGVRWKTDRRPLRMLNNRPTDNIQNIRRNIKMTVLPKQKDGDSVCITAEYGSTE